MKILITGGAGFIGSSLARKLLLLGHDVTILDALSRQIHGDQPQTTSSLYRSIAGKTKFIRGTVCDRSVWNEALDGREAVIHLAAETGTGQSMYEIGRYSDVNVGGTALLLDIIANCKNSIRKVVVASSRAVYGEGKYRSRALGIVYPGPRKDSDMRAGRFEHMCAETGEPLEAIATDEDSKVHPTSVYGITKLTQEQLVTSVCRALGINAVALRYQNVYGPGQSLSNPYTGILSIFSTRLLNNNELNIFEDGLETRDFIYIDDVVDATIAALFAERMTHDVFGIGSGVATSVQTVAHELAKHLGASAAIRTTGEYRLGDIRHNYADINRARDFLAFEAKIGFSEGVRRFAEWVRSQAVETDTYDESLKELKLRGLFRS